MGIINIVKNVKKIHPYSIVVVKIGKFYYTYGKDSYIISYLFNYKITTLENVYRCGFIDNSFNMVIAKLEQKKISYLVLDRKNNYDVENFVEYKNLNNYLKTFEEAKKKINIKIRINRISSFLNNNLENCNIKNILKDIENIINERGKI